ncbi:hypothetical protein [Rhizobium leguminosarum]|uniref:hypothetical protein n=1 Tax=Rhizobium leguminosarum TaxID=384 RepID=UPI00102F4F2E|nr:hypothetical protein [Rhizobium leguminosarum]TAU79267.1 hypothetical protein ELI41_32570 [Rhizobium leguminosarum]TAV40772.1 hypothetical protein ELI29_36160 [Rhizobium leguminosarum]TAV41719.1 hypothetical protein ELI31_30860 [Rhizobium leguminosarum]TAV42186.1 hypothetical protein ELI32_32175 [Rhizobium leguminosarum]TAV61436.1 hypothetical protein ELI30_31985 [Rhizobium leguminosarum]
MPRMISFILTRLATGFAIGCAVGFVVWQNGLLTTTTTAGTHYLAQGLFIYFFASTMSVGYLATALLLEEE